MGRAWTGCTASSCAERLRLHCLWARESGHGKGHTCPQAPEAQSSSPQLKDSASVLQAAILSWAQSQGPSLSPLPTRKLDPAQHSSCCQSPSSQPDTCSYSWGRPSLPSGLGAGQEGACGAESTTSVSPARQGPQMGPPEQAQIPSSFSSHTSGGSSLGWQSTSHLVCFCPQTTRVRTTPA